MEKRGVECTSTPGNIYRDTTRKTRSYFYFLLLWLNTHPQKQLKGEGVYLPQCSKLQPTAAETSRQQDLRAASHVHSQEQRENACILVLSSQGSLFIQPYHSD